MILSGEAEMWQESSGRRTRLRRQGAGESFGAFGISRHQRRSADVVASARLTCLVPSPAPPPKFAGRGDGARLAGTLPSAPANPPSASGNMQANQGVVSCDRPAQLGEMPPGVRRTRREG